MSALGAVPTSAGTVEFRVWAPSAESVDVRVGDVRHELVRERAGTWSALVDAAPGDDYVFVLDGERELADPCSRFQPRGIGGSSRVVDTARFEIAPLDGVPLEELVAYELQVGTFSEAGTFDGAIPHLAPLRELGVTVMELMPVGTFPGKRNWGYDGVYTYAPHPVYGGPEGLARFVDAAHRARLAVILDVVYNHVGPGNHLSDFGPYFTDRHETFWGDALDYAQDGVREWAIQNAELWIRDYGIDGLRVDAETRALYERLLRLRRELPRETSVDVQGKTVTIRRGEARLVVDLDAKS